MNFGFNSFEEAYAYYNRPTRYEAENGIKEISRNIVPIADTVKLVEIMKSDNTRTLVIFYASNSRWIYWCPTEKDFEALQIIINNYAYINKCNKVVKWQGRKE